MRVLRHLIIAVLVMASAVPPAHAQTAPRAAISAVPAISTLRLKIPPIVAQDPQPPRSATLHPAAKGALVGAAIGAGSWAGIGLWYCIIGPNEVGECGVEQWVPGFLVWGGIGAGIGALIGALR